MDGIPAELLSRLRKTLLRCDLSDSMLQTVFSIDKLKPWRDRLSSVNAPEERVNNVINLLVDQELSATHESALVVFLRELSQYVHPGDACHDELLELAERIESTGSTIGKEEPVCGDHMPPISEKFADFDFTFQDREKPRADILQNSANHIELYGPAGSGKTYLLHHLNAGRDDVHTVYINLDEIEKGEHFVLQAVLSGLKKKASRNSRISTRNIAKAISDLYKSGLKHIVFMFDSVDAEKHKDLIHWLVSPKGLLTDPELYEFLHRLGISLDKLKLQIIISTLRPCIRLQNYPDHFHFDRIQVSHLGKDPDPIKDPIQNMLRELAKEYNFDMDPANCKEISDEVYYHTGGHPKCAQLVLFEVANVDFLPGRLDWRNFFSEKVLPTVLQEMLMSVSDDLRPVFKVLSIFRIFDKPLLVELIEAGFLSIPGGFKDALTYASQLLKDLASTYLINRATLDRPFFSMNFAVRRTLCLSKQYQSPELYNQINTLALDVFEIRLKACQDANVYPALLFMECMYHQLKILTSDDAKNCKTIQCELLESSEIYFEYLFKIIGEDGDSMVFFQILKDCWERDEELRVEMQRATEDDECHEQISRRLESLVKENHPT